jgi:serine/threonine protein kinase
MAQAEAGGLFSPEKHTMTTVVRGPWEGLAIAGGRYCDLKTLGEGGMGYVYRALDQNLRVPVVIKTPRRALVDDPEHIRRFELEIGAMVQLPFPHIVPVIDVGRHDGLPFAVMRYMSGGSLLDRMARAAAGHRLPMTTDTLAGWLPSIAGALDFMHARGYLHRDVKPPNILFDQNQQAYLSDFGVIKVLGEATAGAPQRLTGQGFVVGTVEYMAPELLTEQPFDGRADQYALAVTVYEVLSGGMPFAGKTPAAVMVQQLNEVARPLADRVARLPAGISDAVVRAMSKDPRQRFNGCVEFAEAVMKAATASARGAPAATAAWPSPTNEVPVLELAPDDTDRRTRITSVAGSQPVARPPRPVNAPSPQAATTRKNRGLAVAAVAVAAVAVLAAGAVWFSQASPDAQSVDRDAPLPSNPLPKRMAEWKDRADKLERVLWIESAPLLAKPRYASSAELIAQLDASAGTTGKASGKELAALEHELTSMAEVQQRTAKQLQHYRQQHSTASASPEVNEDLANQQRALDDCGSQLLAFARRLQAIKQATASPQGRYDAGATAELTTLREMEAAAAADHPVVIKASTLDRAAALATASNPGLAWLATNVLARSDRPQAARQAIQWLGTYPPDRQAALCWSLLLSGQSESVGAAEGFFQAHPALLANLQRAPLIKLVSGDVGKYQAMLPLLIASCTTGDERFELFRLQAPRMTDGWATEIEQACTNGLLADRVEKVLLEILAGHHKAAYPLAARLLANHHTLTLSAWPPEQLETLLGDSPELAGKLAAQWIVRGNAAQRTAALAVYCDPRSKLTPEQLQLRLETDHPLEPTLLLNQALASTQARALQLAEFLLTQAGPLEPAKLNYAAASSEALARPALRTALFKLAWQASDQGQAWVLEHLLGAEFVEKFKAADATHERQLQLLVPVVKTLDGKLVTLKNLGASAFRDRGLQLTAKEIAHLPENVDPAPWAPEAASHAGLAKLQSQLEPVRKSADATYAAALDQIDRYLSDLVSLNTLTYQLMNIYDVTINKQLAGAKREVQLKHLEAWDFRFINASHQNFERQNALYRDLVKSIATTRQSLPIVQQTTAK